MRVEVKPGIFGCFDGDPLYQLELDPESFHKLLWMMSDECDIAVPFWVLAKTLAEKSKVIVPGVPPMVTIRSHIVTTSDPQWFINWLSTRRGPKG